MKSIKSVLPRAAMFLFLFTLICGVFYTGAVTVLAQTLFPAQANGSIVEIDGKKYGCELLGQQYTDDAHMWGRMMNVDTATFKNEEGKPLMYGVPSNLSPASEEYEELIAARIVKIRAANPAMKETAIPVDLVTCSGSGLDPHISKAAAEYQTARLASANNRSEDEIRKIIKACTTGKFLGVFGEDRVNVLKVNLALDGIFTIEDVR
ncbi:MAG: K(+)-transporting ATPase subunit C [Clostridium sp.]